MRLHKKFHYHIRVPVGTTTKQVKTAHKVVLTISQRALEAGVPFSVSFGDIVHGKAESYRVMFPERYALNSELIKMLAANITGAGPLGLEIKEVIK